MPELLKMISKLQQIYEEVEDYISVINDVINTALENDKKIVVKYKFDNDILVSGFYIINWDFYFGNEEGHNVLVNIFDIEDIKIM